MAIVSKKKGEGRARVRAQAADSRGDPPGVTALAVWVYNRSGKKNLQQSLGLGINTQALNCGYASEKHLRKMHFVPSLPPPPKWCGGTRKVGCNLCLWKPWRLTEAHFRPEDNIAGALES